MKRLLLNAARLVWHLTPSKRVRKLYFLALTRLLRGRRKIATIDGIRFDLDLSESIDVAVFLEGYEKDVKAAIDRYCGAGAVVLDVGANIGPHALYLARAVGEQGGVYAFEPSEYAFNKLRRNLELNNLLNIEALRLALSDKSLAGQVVNFRSSWRTDGKRADTESTVTFARLDDWCREKALNRLDLIKLDVDGGEYQILHGGEETLRRYRPTVIMEVGAWHFKEDSENPLLLLSRLGYRFEDAASSAKYVDVEGIRKRLPPEDPAMTFSINVVGRVY